MPHINIFRLTSVQLELCPVKRKECKAQLVENDTNIVVASLTLTFTVWLNLQTM